MRRALPLIVAAALLSGCVATPPTTGLPGRAVDPARVVDWTANGRLAIAVGHDGGSGAFAWRQRAASSEVQVRGPLGAGGLNIALDGDALLVTDANGATLDAEAAREQIRARLGTEVPLAALRYWLLGLAAPDSPARVEEHAGSPARVIEQAGWSVSYEPFRAVEGWAVPTRLTAVSGPARLRIIVDGWHIPAAGPRPDAGSAPQ
jgi:outer membrane lipoprotein LolB